MNDETKNKMKAVIEAMLFVAVQPIPISKMVKKLRQVAKREAANNEQEPTLEQCSEEIDPDTNNGQRTTDNEIDPDTDNEIDPDTNNGQRTTDNEIDQDTNNEQRTTDNEIDPMQQLLNKQQELQDEITASDIKTILLQIQEELSNQDHGVELVAVAKGYQLRTKYEISMYLKEEKVQTPSRFSPSSLETLSIIAYQQPITRQKVEDIRGVDSGGVLKTLLDKNIIRMVGRSEDAGRAIVYGTSKKFLEVFGINQLRDLPNLSDYQALKLSTDEEEKRFNQESFEEHGFVGDLMDDAIDYLTQEEEAILGDLNESIKSLRQVEKSIVMEHFTEPVSAEGSDAENPEPVSDDVVVSTENEQQTPDNENQEPLTNTSDGVVPTENGQRTTDNENKEAQI
ncbi:SMC-Scp complex subunit ScpB [bacterium]|nr:SMC-Scp complex subunit ScpB [bacterium]